MYTELFFRFYRIVLNNSGDKHEIIFFTRTTLVSNPGSATGSIGVGVWPVLAATTAARDGASSICLHSMKIRKVLTATTCDEPRDEAAAARW